jgi:iron-sulfur cluster repair protein YtfE (RIC family)
LQTQASGEECNDLYLKELVQKLLGEHRDFSSQTAEITQSIDDAAAFARISKVFVPLREALIEHMLVEESEIFPEVSRRGLFTERISEIMQQHLDITAALENMRFALHGKNLNALKSAFEELSTVMKLHFPAEESEVFPLIS